VPVDPLYRLLYWSSVGYKTFCLGVPGEPYLRSEAPWFQGRVLQTLEGTFRLWEGLAERALKGPLPVTEEAFLARIIFTPWRPRLCAGSCSALCGR